MKTPTKTAYLSNDEIKKMLLKIAEKMDNEVLKSMGLPHDFADKIYQEWKEKHMYEHAVFHADGFKRIVQELHPVLGRVIAIYTKIYPNDYMYPIYSYQLAEGGSCIFIFADGLKAETVVSLGVLWGSGFPLTGVASGGDSYQYQALGKMKGNSPNVQVMELDSYCSWLIDESDMSPVAFTLVTPNGANYVRDTWCDVGYKIPY